MEQKRKLAHIEQIISIEPIPGADLIEKVTVLGWSCVAQKSNNFKEGDLVVYIETDSILPEIPKFEFLRDRKFRVRIIKLKGQISMGLVLPLTDIPSNVPVKSWKCGDDVTELLGITKYLSPSERTEIEQLENSIKLEKSKLKKFLMRYSFFRRLFLSKKGKSGFPYWCHKTDEERIQNIPHVLEQFKDKEVYVTEKIDYQSGTWTGKMVSNTTPLIGKLLPKKYQFVVCSRNLTTNDKASLYWKIARKYNLEQILKENPTLTIQGEQGDTKVQGNKYCITEPTMWVFNIIDHEKGYHYNWYEMEKFCDKYKLLQPPLVEIFNLSKLGSTVQELVEFSKGKSVINPNVEREGIVVRCIENGKKILSFKVINPLFLLKYSDE